jgi:hypothetical protein
VEETFERVMAAVLAAASANNKLPELVAVTMKKLRQTDPKAAS